MSPDDVLRELAERGVTLVADGERLRARPREAITPDLRAALLAHKPDLMRLLGDREAADIGWRVEAMRQQIRPGPIIPFLVARRDFVDTPGHCLSCGDPCGPGRRYRCGPCVRAAEIVRKEAIDENELFITALLSISSDAKELGMTEEQRLFGERAIKSAEALPASSEKERLVSRLTLARIYMQQDRLLEAEAILNKLRGEIEKADPPDAKIHALIINNIGLLHQRIYDFQGGKDRLENAEKCFTEAYELAKKDGDNPLEAERAYCSRLANLAVIKVRKGKLGESTDMLKQAVEACEKRLGTDDPGLERREHLDSSAMPPSR